MPSIQQEALRTSWRSAQKGRLCAWEVAKAVGLREASKEIHNGVPNIPWIAARVTKVGGGHPTRMSLHELFAQLDADPEWFPGKQADATRGRKPLFNRRKRRCVALSAMAAKRHKGEEPCVDAVLHACPAATWNPETRKPFCDRTIRGVFTTACYDFEPDHPWKFQTALQKVFLPGKVKQHRWDMAKYLLRYSEGPAWWAQHVVWFDPCATIIPGSQKQYDQMRQALKGSKRYISDDAKLYSPNLQGPPTALKQKQWEGKKVNWFMVVARGVVHVEVMPPNWALNGHGLASFVKRLPHILRKMLGPCALLPRHIFTDRGTGMYNPVGKVVQLYAAAVKKAGFNLHWGPDASRQSPDMGDILLHETAVAWLRKRMKAEKPQVLPWEETQDQWATRARQAVCHINANHDVAGLCREFPSRLQSVVETQGGRLRK